MRNQLRLRRAIGIPALVIATTAFAFGDANIFNRDLKVGGGTLCLPLIGGQIIMPGKLSDLEAARNYAHERVHAAQCAELGALKMNAMLFTSEGRLELEAPAWCVGTIAGQEFMGAFSPWTDDEAHAEAIDGIASNYRTKSHADVEAHYNAICDPIRENARGRAAAARAMAEMAEARGARALHQ